jgi:hypothetical protein
MPAGRRCVLLLLAAAEFGLNFGRSHRCLLMAILRRESIKFEGFREVLQTAQSARFKSLTHAVCSIGISVGGFL